MRWLKKTIPLLALVVAVVALLVWFGWIWWWFPKWQVERLRSQLRGAKDRADVEDNIRKSLSQVLGGATLLLGAGVAAWNAQSTLRASRDLLTYQQIAKGFEFLGNKEAAMRIGGIYILEGVMKTSEGSHQPVLDGLCAFMRDGTQTVTGPGPPASDIQTALTVIGRNYDGRTSDLTFVHIPGADLTGAKLRYADLTEARLMNANLTRADLTNAILIGADLTGATLPGANLSGADLSGAIISPEQLKRACGANAKLPPGLTLEPCVRNFLTF